MKRTLLMTVFAGATLLSMQETQAQTPIYREVFGNSTALNQNVTTVGWVGAYGAAGAGPSSLGGAFTNNFGISSVLGDPQNLGDINAGTASSQANGLLFTSGGTMATASWIAYTTGYTVDTSVNSIQDISFYAGSANNAVSGIPGFRVAVQIDGNWYVTSQVFANTVAVGSAANFNTLAQQETFNWTTSASAWDSLTFVPGTSLVLGSTLTSDLPGGSVTGFGLYSDQEPGAGNATRRFDTFQIDAVPEPGSVMLALFGVGVLMSFRPSRKA
jgi:hypothetical protein